MKRFAIMSLSIASTLLSVASTLVMLSGGAFALDPRQQLEVGNARLTLGLDTASAKQGQLVTARLTQTIETPEGLKLPNGTALLGHVALVQASHDKSAAKLALTFDKAQMKDGSEVAIKATLIEVAPAGAPEEMETRIAGNDSFDQEPGALSGVSLHSAVQGQTSGMLISRDKNFRLTAGMEMQIAVAPASGGNINS
jgi:hypothetical protein